jgi:transposase
LPTCLPVSSAWKHRIPALLEDAANGLPGLAPRLLGGVWQRITQLNHQILAYDREIEQMARQSDLVQRLMTIPGIGAITATALVASLPEARQFKNETDRTSCWLRELVARRGYKRAAVALAAKTARIVWVLLTSGQTYQAKAA